MLPPLDVAMVSPYPPAGERHGGHSGVASYTANLAHALVDQGIRVGVVAPHLPGDPPSFADGDVHVDRVFGDGPRALASALDAAGDLAPVVHLQWELFLYGGPATLAGLVPALGARRLRRAPVPLITTMHQVVEPSTVDRRYTALHRVTAPAAMARAGIAGVQHGIRAASTATVVHEEPFRRVIRGATVIPHGIERVGHIDRHAARAALGLGDELVVLCFGFLAPYKGIDVVLEAARHVPPSVRVVVAGGEHPRLAGGVDSFADDLRRRYGAVATFPGWVADHDVATWFSAADVAVFPYPQPFSSSGVLALALAHRTPVLLSPALARCVGAPNLLNAPMEPTVLARRLADLAGDRGELARLGRWSAILGERRAWPTVAGRHAQLYRAVVE